MVKYTPDAELAHRMQQIERTHEHTKALHEAAEAAIKHHDKYLAAVETVMSCLLDNSDCMEEMRGHLGNGSHDVDPTYEVTGAVAGAFSNFKSSVQVKALRDCLWKLASTSTVAKRHSKVTRSSIEEYDAAALKYVKRSTRENPQKLARATEKKREKLLQEQKEEEKRLAAMNAGVVQSMQSLCAWWAGKLVEVAEELVRANRDVGAYLARCYEDTAQLTAPQPSGFPRPMVAAQGRGAMATEPFHDRQPRDDTSSYIGVSDYLNLPTSQLPATALRGPLGSPDGASARSPSPPPALYPSVRMEVPPTVSAPPSESSVSAQRRSPYVEADDNGGSDGTV